MQRITNISAHNFMTFDEVSLSLGDKCYIIKGENKDDQGQQSNGSGKTSLVDIIAVTLLGQSLTGRDLKECVNWNGADSFFTTSLTLFNGYETIITRKVYNNTRSAELSITVNGQPVKGVMTKAGIVNGVDVKEGNKYILESILGISKEDLLNYFLISSSDYQSFFKANNSKKIEIISRFSNAQKVDQVITLLETEVKGHNSTIFNLQSTCSNLEGQITALEQSIDQDALKAFEDSKAHKVQSLIQSIEQLDKEIGLLKEEKVDSTDYQIEIKEISAQIEQIRSDIKKLDEERKPLVKIAKDIENKLAGEIECPKCKHHFILQSNDSVESMKKELDELNKTVTELNEANIELIGFKEIGIDKLELAQFEEDEKQKAIKRNINLVKQREELKSRIASKELELVEIDSKQFEDSGIKKKILEVEDKKKDTEKQLSNVKENRDLKLLWIDRFKQFKFYLANKPVEVICHYANQFLKQIGSEFTIEIEGFKTLKSGELRAELTPVVYRNGINPRSYNSFSEGEKVRLNIAADLALQRLVNENSGKGLLFYLNDELVNSIDSQGLLQAAKAFNTLNQTILLISHSGSDLNYDNQITVSKQNGKTTLV